MTRTFRAAIFSPCSSWPCIQTRQALEFSVYRAPPPVAGADCSHAIEASFRGKGEASLSPFFKRPSPESLPRSVAGLPIPASRAVRSRQTWSFFPERRPDYPGRLSITPRGLAAPDRGACCLLFFHRRQPCANRARQYHSPEPHVPHLWDPYPLHFLSPRTAIRRRFPIARI